MSVLAQYRNESPFAVRDEARKLEVKIMKLCMNEKYFPKRYRFILAVSIIEDAHKMVDFIETANILPLDKTFHKRRLAYQKEAYARIENILRKLILAENLGFTIPDGTLKELGKALMDEERHISNWIDSDKKRL